MASSIISKILPASKGEPSIYETLREHDDLSFERYDIEERAGMILDEDNAESQYHDYELGETISGGQVSPSGATRASRPASRSPAKKGQRQKHVARSMQATELDDLNDEVPPSLLIEDDGVPIPLPQHHQARTPSVAREFRQEDRATWQAAQQTEALHSSDIPPRIIQSRSDHRRSKLAAADPREDSLWMWANVENLDNFLTEIYEYFAGNGIWCITLNRILHLLTLAFVVAFSTFLTSCISYKQLPGSKTISQILVPKCSQTLSGSTNLWIWLFAVYWLCKLFQCVSDLPRLRRLQKFYRYLLLVADGDIQTVAWQEIVKKLMDLRDLNPTTAGSVKERHRNFMGTQSKQRMDAHDIANRLMRRENYLIALINKDILDLTLPVPFLRDRQFFSKTLQWNLSMCILDHVFDPRGQVRPQFLKDTHRRALSESLKRRFVFAGFMNALCAPFIVIFFMLFYFFRYFNEYQRNPSQIGSRQYTPLAEWKFREFNELWHLFERRLNMSYPFASRYLDQFPKDKTIQVAKFVAFVAGALASILALASLVDPESFLAFELTSERTVLFYLGLFGTIWAIARGAVPEENVVFDPEYTLRDVIGYTHYMPDRWQGQLHSNEVKGDFAQLYKMKIFIFLEELISILLTPFILWLSLPKCSDKLVDFFREFTIHVDGLGYVCSFAVFDFGKGGKRAKQGLDENLREDYYATKDNKMLASYYGFVDNYVTNQRPGAPFIHPEQRQGFHAPPVFPGLATSVAGDLHNEGMSMIMRPTRHTKATSKLASVGVHGNRSIHKRTPKMGAATDVSSPIASVLLDPQNQPMQMTAQSQRRVPPQSRLRTLGRPLESQLEIDEGKDAATLPKADVGTIDDDILSESWKTTHAGDREDHSVDNTHFANDERDPGVLGLVYQFSKAHTDGRGTGVNI